MSFIPIFSCHGEIATYQMRADFPKMKGGKPVKYQTVAGDGMVLDIPPAIRHQLPDPSVPLFITEGVRKADAAVSHGVCCIDVLGVWSWRGTNEWGGKTALPDWESIALNGRELYIVFDSDVMAKSSVHMALTRLYGFLGSRKASVQVIYLPPTPSGQKVGLDDFFAAGGSVEQLLALAEANVRPLPELDKIEEYEATPAGMVHNQQTREGIVTQALANFTAEILEDIEDDDASGERQRVFKIRAVFQGREFTFDVAAERYESLEWVLPELGARAIVSPRHSAKANLAAAIQTVSNDLVSRTRYTHTGWRLIGGEWHYLHGSGAIGPIGPVTDVSVQLTGAAANYCLPNELLTAKQVKAAVKSCMQLLDLLPLRVSVPVFGSIWRSLLSTIDGPLFLVGRTGTGKSAFAALAQQFFGATMDRTHLPANWSSTANANEETAFAVKDALLVIDDFAPHGSVADIQRMNKEAERIFRAQGNGSGRGRLTRDIKLRPVRPPRGLILATGEDVPTGESVRARLLVIEIAPGDMDWDALTGLQLAASNGTFAAVTAAFLGRLAGDYGPMSQTLEAQQRQYAVDVVKRLAHPRGSDMYGSLMVGLEIFAEFAVDVRAIASDRLEETLERWKAGLVEAVERQGDLQRATRPAARFIELLRAQLSSGAVRLASPNVRSHEFGSDEFEPLRTSRTIGWIDKNEIYLEMESAYAAAQELATKQGQPLAVSKDTMSKRLNEDGYLITTGQDRGKLTVRKMLDGKRREVLHVRLDVDVHAVPAQSVQSDRPVPVANARKNSGRTNPAAEAQIPNLEDDPAA